MNRKVAEQSSSLRFWIWGFVFIFLLHAFAIFFFADRNRAEPLWQKPGAFFYFAGDADTEQRIRELTAFRDPTLFALPHSRGFSGSAWLNFRPPVPRLTNSAVAPEWLALSVEQLGAPLNEYTATNRPSGDQLFASLRATKGPEVRIPAEAVFTSTVARVEGELARRQVVSQPPLPPATNADVLRSTVVLVSVNGDGVVETASVSGESGSKTADAQAVGLARQFAFEPLPLREARARELAPPTPGRIVFTWHVVTAAPRPPATASTR